MAAKSVRQWLRPKIASMARSYNSINRPLDWRETATPMDHDQAFKNLILDYPAAALEFFAGIRNLAGATITPVREEQWVVGWP